MSKEFTNKHTPEVQPRSLEDVKFERHVLQTMLQSVIEAHDGGDPVRIQAAIGAARMTLRISQSVDRDPMVIPEPEENPPSRRTFRFRKN